jgi:hypothetical protein
MKAATTAPVLIVIRNQNAKRELTGKFRSVLERLLSQGASSGSSSSPRCAGVVIKGEKQEQKEEKKKTTT